MRRAAAMAAYRRIFHSARISRKDVTPAAAVDDSDIGSRTLLSLDFS